jgi:hypothetical protein
MSYISKVELKYQLQKMGIKVEGNYIKKKDIIKVLSASDEKEIDIGYGWKYYEGFPPAIKHKEYGYHIIPSDGSISGRLFKQGKHLDAAKHQAYVHTPKDKVSKEQMDEVSKIRKPFGG